ncbi:MAG: WD40 repeat domain-containing protein [Spirochaetaceae bacterium]|nr:WD40 repeat domain-containing protein [Spirochaetaceae bacterium]
MAKNKKKYWIPLSLLLFIVYTFVAARPIPVETILVPRWLSSLESDYPVSLESGGTTAEPLEEEVLLPFKLGSHFGYVDAQGFFSINRVRKGYVSLSEEYWAEYEAVPETVAVFDPRERPMVRIDHPRGYPFFLDKRIFVINDEQNSLSLVDSSGEIRWVHDFAAPVTDIDAAAGLVLAGSLDGAVELLGEGGERLFFFEPGGSRLSVILSCRISGDGSKLAIVSGYDDQRFLLLEKFGDSYKVSYHEFISDGFRRPVHLAFIGNDSRIVFERKEGIGIYDINTRNSLKIPLDGSISAIESSGKDNLFFIITSKPGGQNKLVAIRLPGTIIMEAPFKSGDSFLARRNSRLFVGGGTTLAAFDLDKR